MSSIYFCLSICIYTHVCMLRILKFQDNFVNLKPEQCVQTIKEWRISKHCFFFLCNRGLGKVKSLKYFVWWFKGFDKNTKFEVREKYLKYNKNKRTRETKQEFWQGVNIYFLKIANFFVVILWANCSFMIVWCCLNMMWNTKHGICW